jgi:hypothetical protein
MEEEKREVSEEEERATIKSFVKACEDMRKAYIEACNAILLTPNEGMLMPTVMQLYNTVPVLGELVKQWEGLAQSAKLVLPSLPEYRKLKTVQEKADFLNKYVPKEIAKSMSNIKFDS